MHTNKMSHPVCKVHCNLLLQVLALDLKTCICTSEMLQTRMSDPCSLIRGSGKYLGYQRTWPGASRVQCRVVCENGDAKQMRKALKKARRSVKESLRRIDKGLGGETGEMDVVAEQEEASTSAIFAAQKELYDRELERWDQERKMWDEREQALLCELQRLQGLVIDLASRGDQPQIYPHQYQESAAQSDSLSAEPEQEVKGAKNSSAGTKAPQFFDSNSAFEDGSVSTVAASMSAAFAAVDQGDVLSDNFGELQKNLEENFSGNGQKSNVASEDSQTVSGEGASDAPVEVVKSPPTGPPPELVEGDDDIYWVSKLQQALEKKGFYCGEQDCEDYFFAEGTSNALLSFQACEGLTETGTADKETWIALLGEEARDFYSERNVTDEQGAVVTEVTGDTSEIANVDGTEDFSETDSRDENGAGKVNQTEELQTEESTPINPVLKVDPTLPKSQGGWPVLQESDGGKEVHALHVCLEKNGFHCGDDDMNWWFFGDDTIAALKTFQACNGLPESGSCNEKTWLTLLGENAKPDDLQEMVGDSSYDEDRAAQGPNTGGVWLLGEQRWEKR